MTDIIFCGIRSLVSALIISCQEGFFLKIVDLEWSSKDGLATYHPIYEDGSKGREVWTDMQTNNSVNFMSQKKKVEFELIGAPRA